MLFDAVAVRRGCDTDALPDFNMVSCLAFQMTYPWHDPCCARLRTLPFPPKHCQHCIISLTQNDWLAAAAC